MTTLEERVIEAAEANDARTFAALAIELGGLAKAQELVRTRGTLRRVGGIVQVTTSARPAARSNGCDVLLRSSTSPVAVVLTRYARADLMRQDFGSGIEAGGALLGTFEGTELHITEVTGNGLDSVATSSRLELNVQGFAAIEEAYRGTGIRLLGDWHSHETFHNGTRASEADVRGWAAGLHTRVGAYAGLIVSPANDGDGDMRWLYPSLNAWVARRANGRVIVEPATMIEEA